VAIVSDRIPLIAAGSDPQPIASLSVRAGSDPGPYFWAGSVAGFVL